MGQPSPDQKRWRRERDEARARLAEAEQALHAIRNGEVDSLVVNGAEGPRVFTLQGAEEPYRLLIEQMNEGALTLSPEGIILFANQTFARLVRRPLEQVIGAKCRALVEPEGRAEFEELRRAALAGARRRCEIRVRAGQGLTVPLELSLCPLRLDTETLVCIVATDIRERKQADAQRMELMRRLVASQELERRRIALELHDQLGQDLTTLSLGLKALEQPKSARGTGPAPLRQLRKLTDRLMRQMHQLALDLRPAALDDLGLESALRRHVAEWSERWGIPARFDSLDWEGVRLDPLVETMLYRVAQEALTNVLKHAQARNVHVLLQRQARQVLLIVDDDGQGFELDAMNGKNGSWSRIGLRSMNERMELVGGALRIESAAGRGTTLLASAPMIRRLIPGEAKAGLRRHEAWRMKHKEEGNQP